MYKKPTNFMELLELQKVLDDKTAAERPNGFKPRPRTERDIRFALDDEFNEFMKELPDELNFKTWKQKEWSAERQLIEYADCWFFMAQAINCTDKVSLDDHLTFIELFEDCDSIIKSKEVVGLLSDFKSALSVGVEYTKDIQNVMWYLLKIGVYFGYNKETILNAYWKKWNKNMGRTEEDWTL